MLMLCSGFEHGRRWRFHWAMAAAHNLLIVNTIAPLVGAVNFCWLLDNRSLMKKLNERKEGATFDKLGSYKKTICLLHVLFGTSVKTLPL